MCAIAGAVSINNGIDLSEDVLRMTKILRHRGPDSSGFFTDREKGAYLGFNRLSIVDLSDAANQPLINEDKNIALVLNGEIYNYQELRKELEGSGHKFVSASDSETVLHAYEEWGDDCVGRLRGMFAFAIWDSRRNRLFLARDRIGIKPLYFTNNNSTFCFASEIKAFLGLRDEIWKPELNPPILDMYLNFPFIMDNNNTLLKGINKMPPAHTAVFENGKVELRRYWELAAKGKRRVSFQDALNETEEVLLNAIRCHFTGDVPIALMLSGGLDSSLIGALSLKAGKNIELAITTSHTGFAFDERGYGRTVAKHLGLKHAELVIDTKEIADKIDEYVWHFDDLSIIGFFYQIAMSKMVSDLGYKVIMVGQGADEIFGGYHISKLSMFPFSILPSEIWNMCYYKMLTNRKFGTDYFRYTSLIKKPFFHPGKEVLNLCSDFEINYQLPNYNLTAEDKGFMSHSVESRVPYLDHHVVEYVYNLPQQYKLKGYLFSRKHEIVKHILRVIANRYLPPEIAQRKKQGAALPVFSLLEKNMEKVRQSLIAADSLSRSIIGARKVAETISNPRKNAQLLSRLYILEVWKNMFLKKRTAV